VSKVPDSFCLVPWYSVFIEPKSIGPCCVNYKLSNTNSIEDYLKSKELSELKKEFLKGNKPASCTFCWKAESIGIKSVRQEKSKTIMKEYQQFIIRISNKCNYTCRMCNSKYSSAWENDKKASILKKSVATVGEATFNIDIYKKNINYIINEAKRKLITIDIIGGEPLISDEFIYFLEETKKENVRENIKLNINSNISVTTYKNIEYLKEFSNFNKVVIHASVDGIGKVGEYIRRGYKQPIFNKNLQYFKKYIKFINVTLQIYNIYDIPNIYRYAKDNNIGISINYLIEPKCLSIALLDYNERFKILEHYKNTSFHNKELEDAIINEIVNLELIDNFIIHTSGLDKLWKTDFIKSIPELASWYERVQHEKYNMV
jgi:MoaA/NifB/PqqE/SkfB family radical SAM enzyme